MVDTESPRSATQLAQEINACAHLLSYATPGEAEAKTRLYRVAQQLRDTKRLAMMMSVEEQISVESMIRLVEHWWTDHIPEQVTVGLQEDIDRANAWFKRATSQGAREFGLGEYLTPTCEIRDPRLGATLAVPGDRVVVVALDPDAPYEMYVVNTDRPARPEFGAHPWQFRHYPDKEGI